jgi:hypothetical protein
VSASEASRTCLKARVSEAYYWDHGRDARYLEHTNEFCRSGTSWINPRSLEPTNKFCPSDNSPLDTSNLPTTPAQAAPAGPTLSPLAGVGFTLAKWILCIMSGFILLAGVGLFVHEWHHANIIKTSYEGSANKGQNCAPMEAGIEKIKLQRKEFREFWLQGSQLVLLNLFLPTLTAILGYIFGSRELPPVEASSRNTQG